MRAPGFWWKPGHPAAWLLSPIGAIYGAVTGARMRRTGAGAAVPVICVGNLVAGGAGKTPVALALAVRLRSLGRAPVFLTRGYGGRITAPTLVDLASQDAAETGDEPQLLAMSAPTVVSPRRQAGAALAATLGDVIVMDDGLQNPGLAKTLALAVVDGETGIGNGFCIPAGPLRAPLAAQWPHVDAVIVLGSGAAGDATAEAAARAGIPALRARLVPTADAAGLAGRRVLAFAGIGRPEKFFATLRDLGADVAARLAFGDHAPYDAGTLRVLREQARTQDLALVTTAKDMARLRAGTPGDSLADVTVVAVEAKFSDEPALDALLARALEGGVRAA
jgi:tetraacyldisaccharide 4'-kinase